MANGNLKPYKFPKKQPVSSTSELTHMEFVCPKCNHSYHADLMFAAFYGEDIDASKEGLILNPSYRCPTCDVDAMYVPTTLVDAVKSLRKVGIEAYKFTMSDPKRFKAIENPRSEIMIEDGDGNYAYGADITIDAGGDLLLRSAMSSVFKFFGAHPEEFGDCSYYYENPISPFIHLIIKTNVNPSKFRQMSQNSRAHELYTVSITATTICEIIAKKYKKIKAARKAAETRNSNKKKDKTKEDN